MEWFQSIADRMVSTLVPTVSAEAMPGPVGKWIECTNITCAIFWRAEYEITCYLGGGCYTTRYIGCGC